MRSETITKIRGLTLAFCAGPTLIASFQGPAVATSDRYQTPAASGRATGTPGIVRIASWDLHDMWHESGIALRRGARIRNDADFASLQHKASSLQADIIALQGIGSPRAARKLFPARDYHVVFSNELRIRMRGDLAILDNPAHRRVYNAIAVRRSARIRITGHEHVFELADPSPGLGPFRPQGQSALAIRVRINKRPVWIVSVRLIAGCIGAIAETNTVSEPAALSPPCIALRDQVHVLNAWKSRKAVAKEDVVLAIALPAPPDAKHDNPTVPGLWHTLTASDPVRVAAEYERKARTVRERPGFILTNRFPLNTKGTPIPVQQPNPGPLAGPTRRPGKQLTEHADKDPDETNRNFIVEALREFTRALLEKRWGDRKASRETAGLTVSPGTNDDAVAPPNNSMAGNGGTGVTPRSKLYFVRYPLAPPGDNCRTGQAGTNSFLVNRQFTDFHTGIRSALVETAPLSEPGENTATDCAVYLDVPLR